MRPGEGFHIDFPIFSFLIEPGPRRGSFGTRKRELRSSRCGPAVSCSIRSSKILNLASQLPACRSITGCN